MALNVQSVQQYHVFLASPGDVQEERQIVRQFFDRYNRSYAQLWKVRFEVVDWENYATVGVGRPQELITQQTLERFKESLLLVIGIMGQRFGTPTGKAESGTEEEFMWALDSNRRCRFPEIKWFFRRSDKFVAEADTHAITEAFEQWKKVRLFQDDLKKSNIYYGEYTDSSGFRDALERDLGLWLSDRSRPWIPQATETGVPKSIQLFAPRSYYEAIERDFHRLDIGGIDNDRAFEIPLSEIYVRLRVIFDDDQKTDPEKSDDSEPIEIQTALLKYPKLVIVGDPGSGKSTFLKFVALMLARTSLERNPNIAFEKLALQEPLPIPQFISCWDLSDFLKKQSDVHLDHLLDFARSRLEASNFKATKEDLERLLQNGGMCLLFDGLDEVPTDTGRAVVSRLLESCVKKYPKNRYVVTSRVRAYTGGTILKGEFTRCDVQPFDSADRAEFLKNWISLLFKTSAGEVSTAGSEANREFLSLTSGIENSDRIRPLAVNPLLLTVISIVHWNRKRLPEQRVDLYDECVDVLLGQRKDAEHVQSGRQSGMFDESQESQQKEERAWVRKRFGEIALAILRGDRDHDEAAKSDIIKILAPRFLDQGAVNSEQAEARAGGFLDRQELRSGLLVSRREHSYRFVHLTFQEYLAAWHLSNQEFEQVIQIVKPHIRSQRWFEPLQLLGAEWAKQSDEKLDNYVLWLLSLQGDTLGSRAPVIALCANIVKDSIGTAELKQATRKLFREGVERTLDVFRPKSGIPALTQLEILEALGQLGAPVKDHIVDASKSGLFPVRSRAIALLLPHVSDDDLFAMVHVLADRSKVPIKAFFLSILARNAERTAELVLAQKRIFEKATEAFSEVMSEFRRRLPKDSFDKVVRKFFFDGRSFYPWHSFYSARAHILVNSECFGIEEILEFSKTDQEMGVKDAALRILLSGALLPEVKGHVLDVLRDSDRLQWSTGAIGHLPAHAHKDQEIASELRRLALESRDVPVRRAAFGALVEATSGLTLSEKILFKERRGFGEWIDPTQMITKAHVVEISNSFDRPDLQVRLEYENLSKRFASEIGISLILEWRPPNPL